MATTTTTSDVRPSPPAAAPAPAAPAAAQSAPGSSASLRNIFALAKRELGFYFNSPIAYIVIALFLVVSGLMLFVFDVPDMGTDFFAANEASLRGLFGPTGAESFGGIPLLFVFLVPAVTMRLIAEEKRTGTIELLVTWPVTDAQIVAGKYLGAIAFVGLMLLATLPLVLIVGALGSLDVGVVIGGYFGLLLLGAAYSGLGLMTSAWTSNQIVAYLVGALLCGLFYFVDGMLGLVWDGGRDFFANLSFKAHFQNVARGVVDLRDIVFYASFIALALVITTLSLQARNWKK